MAAIRWQHQNIKTHRRPPIRPPPTPPVLLRAVRNNNPRYNPLRARCPCHRDSIITMVSPFLLFLSVFLCRERLRSLLAYECRRIPSGNQTYRVANFYGIIPNFSHFLAAALENIGNDVSLRKKDRSHARACACEMTGVALLDFSLRHARKKALSSPIVPDDCSEHRFLQHRRGDSSLSDTDDCSRANARDRR